MSEPTYQEICAAFKLSLRDIAKLSTERDAAVLKFKHNQRLCDLVRHQRMELHEAGLISDEEYSELAKDHPAVERLKQYEVAFIGRHALKLELSRAQEAAIDLAKKLAVTNLDRDRLLILCGKMREVLQSMPNCPDVDETPEEDEPWWQRLAEVSKLANEVLSEVKT